MEGGLPEGWAWSRLGDLGEYINGRGFKKSEWSDDGLPIIRIQNLTGSGTGFNYYSGHLEDRYVVHPGDLLISWAATLGVYIWRGREAALNQHIFKVKPFIDLDFLRHLIDYKIQELKASSHGSGMIHITRGKFEDLPVAIPPLAEQRRIADTLEGHISRLNAGTYGLTVAHRKSQRLMSIISHRAVLGAFSRSVCDSEAVNEGTVRLASSSLGTRRWSAVEPAAISGYTPPRNWKIISLGTLSYSSGYGTSTKCAHGASGYPVLRIPNVQGGSIDLADVKNAVDSTLDLSKLSLESGDLLFVRTNGSPSLIGRVGVVERALPYAFASYLIRFRLTPGFVEPRWVQLVTQSPLWRQAIERYAASSAGQYNLSAEILSQLPIPIPPLDVQRETLDSVGMAMAGAQRFGMASDAGATRANSLRTSILHRAFSGELVPQDPDDEPASVLLDRIHVEHHAQLSRSKSGVSRSRKSKQAGTPPPPPPTSGRVPVVAVQQELPL